METLGRSVYCVYFNSREVVELERVDSYALAIWRRSIDLLLNVVCRPKRRAPSAAALKNEGSECSAVRSTAHLIPTRVPRNSFLNARH